MQKEKFKIAHADGVKEVEGRRIIIPGFEGINFFVHKLYENNGVWTVSELKSGRSVGIYDYTRKPTIKEVIKKLQPFGKEKLVEAISQHISQHKEVNTTMLPIGIRKGDYLVSAKTNKRYRIVNVIADEVIIGDGIKKETLVLYDKENNVDFNVMLDKVNEEMYYVESNPNTDINIQKYSPIKPKRISKTLSPQQKKEALEYLNQADMPDWLKESIIKDERLK